jgi:glycosyltransferase involved in cell wall biosynthesis
LCPAIGAVTAMRILYVINGFNQGGAEHGLLTLLSNEFFAGHDVTVLGLCRGSGSVANAVERIVGTEHFLIADPSEALTPTSLIKGAKELKREVARHRPDLVVLSLKQANVVGRLVLCLFPKVRCVSFEHIMRYRSRRFQWSYKYILWLLSFRVDEVWGDCQDTIDATARYFMPIRRRASHVVPLFCVSDDQMRKTSYVIDDPARIALASRLSPVKNIDEVIDAVHELRRRGKGVRLEIFGEGTERAALQEQIARLGLDDHVTLLGFRQTWRTDATAYDLYVNASDTEGFCIVVAEAMAAGLPVISTDVGGIREYGVHDVNMLKLMAPNADDIASNFAKLLDDMELRTRLGSRAAADMARNYSGTSVKAAGRQVLGGR